MHLEKKQIGRLPSCVKWPSHAITKSYKDKLTCNRLIGGNTNRGNKTTQELYYKDVQRRAKLVSNTTPKQR